MPHAFPQEQNKNKNEVIKRKTKNLHHSIMKTKETVIVG
jgi:hypothetical protein